MLESEFQAEVVSAFERMGALVFKVHGHAMQKAGWPDIQVYHPRWTGQIELKRDAEKATTLQKGRISDLVRLGTPAFVLRCQNGMAAAESHDGQPIGTILNWQLLRGLERSRALFELCEYVTGRLGGGVVRGVDHVNQQMPTEAERREVEHGEHL